MYNAGAYMGGSSFDHKRIEEIRRRTSVARDEKARENMAEVRKQKEQRDLVERIMRESSQQKKVNDIVKAVNICKEASAQTKVDKMVAEELEKL